MYPPSLNKTESTSPIQVVLQVPNTLVVVSLSFFPLAIGYGVVLGLPIAS